MDTNAIASQYFKQYRQALGFANQDKTKIFLSAKDIRPSIDYQYIEALNARLCSVLQSVNSILIEKKEQKEIALFLQDFINKPYQKIKNNNILARLNNQGRRPEQVLFSWLRGFAIVEFFSPILAKIFNVKINSITQIGEDDFSQLETFKRTARADLSISIDNQIVHIEVQSGFQGVNDVKEHKVREAKRVLADKNIKTICVHIDIFNGQVAFIRLDNIDDNDINWITRQQMEGQSVFEIDQNYFKWRLLDSLPRLKDLELGL